MAINYRRFARFLLRSGELAKQQGIKEIVPISYGGMLASLAETYLAIARRVAKAESAFAKEDGEALQALRHFDDEFRIARAVAIGFVPGLVVPDTLKKQPTDTDKANAVETLLDAISEHAEEPWAKSLLDGKFGQLAPVVVKEVNEAIEANKALANARDDRAQAYGPTYEKYMSFKRVVRAACGPHSKEYQRIHMRSKAPFEDENEDENEDVTPPVQPTDPAPAP